MDSNHSKNDDFENVSVSNGEEVDGLTATSPKSGFAHFFENRLVQWVFVLSCVATSAAFTKPSVVSLACNVLAFAVAYFITFHRKILEHVFCQFSQKTFCVAFVFTFIGVGFSVSHFLKEFPILLDRLPTIPAHIAVYLLYLTTAPVFFVFHYAFISRFVIFITELYKTSDKIERYFFAAIMLIAVVAVAVIYNQTNCFYAPVEVETRKLVPWDVVYTFDSACYCSQYYYKSPFMHRALLHTFFLPFAVTAYLGGKILFFVPNAFPILLCLVQTALLGLTVLLLSRLLHLRGIAKTAFLTSYTISYAILLNAITLDGYIISTFWLVCFLYLFSKKSKIDCDYAYIAATGTLVTSGVLVLLNLSTREIKKGMIHIIKVLCSFTVFLLIFGTNFFGLLFSALAYYGKFTGIKLPFYEKFLQFINFIASCFFKPETIIAPPFLENVGTWMSYQLAPVKSLNLLGLALLVFCFLGFVLNYKDKFAQICVFWVAFSFFILCLVGWGTAENGLILYTLYFGWAYFCLAFLAIEKMLQKLPTVKYAVYVALIATFAWVNIPGIYDLIQFGIKYYPAP